MCVNQFTVNLTDAFVCIPFSWTASCGCSPLRITPPSHRVLVLNKALAWEQCVSYSLCLDCSSSHLYGKCFCNSLLNCHLWIEMISLTRTFINLCLFHHPLPSLSGRQGAIFMWLKIFILVLNLVAYAFNLITQKAESGGLWWVWYQP